MELRLLTLGAGQEVGKSCVVLNVQGVNVMFDCGLHLGRKGAERLPDFSILGSPASLNKAVQVVVITHFHIDHIGALPHLTEVLGYRGTVVMTRATQALAQLMLEDFVGLSRDGENALYTHAQIRACLARTTAIDLEAPLRLPGDTTLTAYYAGHVLGAAMVHCTVGATSVLYTGDYNMTADRHLGAARVPCLRPNLLITESTFGTTVRDARRTREREFLEAVHAAVRGGGKVLIPVSAIGSAQELSLLIDSFWQRMGLQVPLYMSGGMATRAAALYAAHSEWCSQGVQLAAAAQCRNPFDMPRFQLWSNDLAHAPGPCVLFATPAMLHGGVSLRVFKEWAPGKDNLVLVPGFCTAGTVGNMLRGGMKKGGKTISIHGQDVHVRCKVHFMAFSLHTDSKGILALAQHVQPDNVVLVHGEPPKMRFLQERIQASLSVPCFMPETGSSMSLSVPTTLPIEMTAACMAAAQGSAGRAAVRETVQAIAAKGQDGERALAILHDRLQQASAGLRLGDGGGQFSADETHATVTGGAVASSNRGGSAVSAVIDELLDQGAPCIDGGGFGVDAALQASAGARGVKRMRLMAPDEAAAAQAATEGDGAPSTAGTGPTGAGGGDVSAREHYVGVVASSCERWLRDSGLGSIRVTQHGSMLQLGDGSVRARFRPVGGWHRMAPEATGREVDSAQRRDAVAASERWTWEVLGGGADDEEDAVALADALVASAQPMQT